MKAVANFIINQVFKKTFTAAAFFKTLKLEDVKAREKEIKKRLFEISTSNFNNSVEDSRAYFKGYIDGAMWADRTMIDKACDWLYEYNRKQAGKMFGTVHTADITINVADFRKAMKGQEALVE